MARYPMGYCQGFKPAHWEPAWCCLHQIEPSFGQWPGCLCERHHEWPYKNSPAFFGVCISNAQITRQNQWLSNARVSFEKSELSFRPRRHCQWFKSAHCESADLASAHCTIPSLNTINALEETTQKRSRERAPK